MDEFGQILSVSTDQGAVCKVCDLMLDEEDASIFIDEWNSFFDVAAMEFHPTLPE